MPNTRNSTDYKLTAVQYYLVEDISQDEVCKIFKCSRRSLMRWVNRYEKDGNVNIHYIENVISKIPKEKYRNIFKGAYERPDKYIPKNKTRKVKKNYL